MTPPRGNPTSRGGALNVQKCWGERPHRRSRLSAQARTIVAAPASNAFTVAVAPVSAPARLPAPSTVSQYTTRLDGWRRAGEHGGGHPLSAAAETGPLRSAAPRSARRRPPAASPRPRSPRTPTGRAPADRRLARRPADRGCNPRRLPRRASRPASPMSRARPGNAPPRFSPATGGPPASHPVGGRMRVKVAGGSRWRGRPRGQ